MLKKIIGETLKLYKIKHVSEFADPVEFNCKENIANTIIDKMRHSEEFKNRIYNWVGASMADEINYTDELIDRLLEE